MSTHAAIGMKNADGTISVIFLERHGYPGYTGVVLTNWFTNAEMVQRFIDLESLEFIEKSAAHPSPKDTGFKRKIYANQEVYLISGKSDFDCGFLYIFDQGKWYCHGIFEGEDWSDLQKLWNKEHITKPNKVDPDLTLQEWRQIQEKFPGDHQTEILIIPWVSNTQLSLARYYGGCTFNGKEYTYVYPIDCLIRKDLFEWVRKSQHKAPRSSL